MSSLRGTLASGGRTMAYAIELQGPSATVHVAGGQVGPIPHPPSPGMWPVHLGGRWVQVHWASDGARIILHADGQTYEFQRTRPEASQPRAAVTGGLHSPMPGVVTRVLVGPGQLVQEGDPLYVVEAMKMEHLVRAVRPGRVTRATGVGMRVESGALVVEVEDVDHGR